MTDEPEFESGRWSGHNFSSGTGRGGEPLNWQHELAKDMWNHWAKAVASIMRAQKLHGSCEDALETTRRFLQDGATDVVVVRVATEAHRLFHVDVVDRLKSSDPDVADFPISDELKQQIGNTLKQLVELNLKAKEE